MEEYGERAEAGYSHGTLRCGPLLQISVVGQVSEESGGYFPEFLGQYGREGGSSGGRGGVLIIQFPLSFLNFQPNGEAACSERSLALALCSLQFDVHVSPPCLPWNWCLRYQQTIALTYNKGRMSKFSKLGLC